MDSPQLENGYTKIANKIIESLAKFRIPGEQMQCLFFIIRKTYGYNKKEDIISNSQFVKGTGLRKGNVSRALKELSKKQLIIKNDNGKIPSYRFNKNYSQWKVLSKKQPVIKKATTVIKNDNKVLSKMRDTKESKETIQKKSNSRFTPPSIDQVREYCLERKNNVDWKKWYNFYSAKGFMIGKNKMKDWRAAVRTWEDKKNNNTPTAHTDNKNPLPFEKTCFDCGFFESRCKNKVKSSSKNCIQAKSYFHGK
jgi:phage replication O-like protein O